MFDIRPMPAQIPADLIAGLLESDTGTIGHFLDAGFMDSGIQGRMPNAKIAGTAITVQLTLPDSIIAHYAMKFTRPGDIIVIDRGQDQRTACWGGTTSVGAAMRGLTGLIMDGAGNDISEANAAGLPIWCRSITPLTTKRRAMGGSLNVPISCGGVSVQPGDAILADENGVLVISPERLPDILAQAREFKKLEDDMRVFLRENIDMSYPDATGVTAIVEAKLKEQGKSS